MNTILIVIVAFLCMFVLPVVLAFLLKNHQKALKITTIIFFVIYLFALFVGTTCELDIELHKTTVYFDYSGKWFDINFLPYDFDLDNILINLFMFFPLGFVVFVFTKKKQFSKTIILSLCLSLIIELYQFILPIERFTELTDIIFNVTSGLISATVCQFLLKKGAFKSSIQTK